MTNIDLETLSKVTGGMRWQDFRPSTNIEDRRGLTPAQSMRVPSAPVQPLPPLTRTPNDLPHQAGLDDIK